MMRLNTLSTWMLIVMMLTSVVAAQAEEVSMQEAQEKARVFITQQEGMNGGAPLARSHTMTKLTSMEMTPAHMEAEGLFAFNLDGGGFVIVSGDDRTIPILGYSTKGTLNWDRMPENMKGWLKDYAKRIAALGNLQAKDGNPIGWNGQSRRASKAAIATMMSTKWNQSEPYNNMCPVYEGEGEYKGIRCATGCTSTATAQVMAYHKWPKEACKEIPEFKLELWNEQGLAGYQTLEALPPVVFQWDKMLDDYYQGEELIGTKEQQDAVAQLIRYAGQGMQMSYSPGSSSAETFMAADALKKYFGYDQGLQDVSRSQYTIEEWEDMIYAELAAQRPVIYGGGSHTFVVDGYDGEGLFHVNWGWGGFLDNFFTLSLLNPFSWQGIGAGTSGLDYSTPQDAIIGVKPATTEQTYTKNHPLLMLPEDMSISADGKELTVPFTVHGYEDKMTGAIGMAYKTAGGEWKQLAKSAVNIINTMVNKYVYTGDAGFSELTEATKLVPMLLIDGFNEWKMLANEDVFVTATPIGGGKVTFSKVYPQLELVKLDLKEPFILDMFNVFKATFMNKGAEYRGIFLLEPTYENDTKPTTEGQSVQGVFLPAGQQTTVNFTFRPSKVGKVKIRITTTDDYEIHAFNVTVSEETGITGVKDDSHPTTGKYYNLNGQVVEHPTKGVFIHNGQKKVFPFIH